MMKAKVKYKIGVLSLGCPRNLVDSENILGRLVSKGHRIVDMDKADIAIVNTCAFIEDAKTESIDAILGLIDLKKEGKLKKVVVYGCLSQRYKDELYKELPEVDAFVGKVSLNHSLSDFHLTPRHYAYLKICEGCVNECSYCIIPKIKGGLSSLDADSVFRKIEGFNKTKVSEVNVVGQDITGYGMDSGPDTRLPGLLKKMVSRGPDIGWIRLLYLYPTRVTDELLDLIKDEPKVCKYIDLPIQHINDRILGLMNRQMKKGDILRLIDKVRRKIPDVAIRTSLIVGFPSETDEEFSELMGFIEEVKFERLGAFIYSREEGTRAYGLGGQLPDGVKSERFNALMLRQQKISEEVNRKLLGKIVDVLIEEKGEDHYLGRSQYDAPEVDGVVYVNSDKRLRPGDFVKAKVTDTLEYDLVGKALT